MRFLWYSVISEVGFQESSIVYLVGNLPIHNKGNTKCYIKEKDAF